MAAGRGAAAEGADASERGDEGSDMPHRDPSPQAIKSDPTLAGAFRADPLGREPRANADQRGAPRLGLCLELDLGLSLGLTLGRAPLRRAWRGPTADLL